MSSGQSWNLPGARGDSRQRRELSIPARSRGQGCARLPVSPHVNHPMSRRLNGHDEEVIHDSTRLRGCTPKGWSALHELRVVLQRCRSHPQTSRAASGSSCANEQRARRGCRSLDHRAPMLPSKPFLATGSLRQEQRDTITGDAVCGNKEDVRGTRQSEAFLFCVSEHVPTSRKPPSFCCLGSLTRTRVVAEA